METSNLLQGPFAREQFDPKACMCLLPYFARRNASRALSLTINI